ncbi:hypothetical protein SRHO_G00206510 [Serrasalmus rhombeus]
MHAILPFTLQGALESLLSADIIILHVTPLTFTWSWNAEVLLRGSVRVKGVSEEEEECVLAQLLNTGHAHQPLCGRSGSDIASASRSLR